MAESFYFSLFDEFLKIAVGVIFVNKLLAQNSLHYLSRTGLFPTFHSKA